MFHSKVSELADAVYNLRTVGGMATRLKSIREADSWVVESGIADLAAGKFFWGLGVPFRFVEPTGVRGLDYDIEYATPERVGRCEVKCKLAENDFSARGIAKSLEKARSQLPGGDGTGMAFLYIPEEWVPLDEPGRSREVFEAIEQFFANNKTTRMTSAVVAFHDRPKLGPDCQGLVLCGSEIANPYSVVGSGLPSGNTVFAGFPRWVSLTEMAG